MLSRVLTRVLAKFLVRVSCYYFMNEMNNNNN